MASVCLLFSVLILMIDEKYFDLNKTYTIKSKCMEIACQDEPDEDIFEHLKQAEAVENSSIYRPSIHSTVRKSFINVLDRNSFISVGSPKPEATDPINQENFLIQNNVNERIQISEGSFHHLRSTITFK